MACQPATLKKISGTKTAPLWHRLTGRKTGPLGAPIWCLFAKWGPFSKMVPQGSHFGTLFLECINGTHVTTRYRVCGKVSTLWYNPGIVLVIPTKRLSLPAEHEFHALNACGHEQCNVGDPSHQACYNDSYTSSLANTCNIAP